MNGLDIIGEHTVPAHKVCQNAFNQSLLRIDQLNGIRPKMQTGQ